MDSNLSKCPFLSQVCIVMFCICPLILWISVTPLHRVSVAFPPPLVLKLNRIGPFLKPKSSCTCKSMLYLLPLLGNTVPAQAFALFFSRLHLRSQIPTSSWGTLRSWTGPSSTAMMGSASCQDTTEPR